MGLYCTRAVLIMKQNNLEQDVNRQDPGAGILCVNASCVGYLTVPTVNTWRPCTKVDLSFWEKGTQSHQKLG
jgi:hypothetical protein